MSYTKYKTSGIVIGGSNIGEGSRNLFILTRHFGLLSVRAQGVRELGSKLKYHLQNLFLLEIHLIRGKRGWVVTEALGQRSFFDSENRNKTRALSRILLLARRMLPEENRQYEIFDIISGGLSFLFSRPFSDEDIRNLEALIVLRFLRALGYIKKKDKIEKFIETNLYNEGLLKEASSLRPQMIREINISLKESGL